jgi:hypothetical protein
MRGVGLASVALILIALSACDGGLSANTVDQESCAVYRSFYDQLPAREQHAFLANSSPEILSVHRVDTTAPTQFDRGAGLLMPNPNDAPTVSIVADTSGYFDQLHTKPASGLSACFPEQNPRLYDDVSDDLMSALEHSTGDIIGVWRLSPVAISSDGRRALIVGGFLCGGLCGGGAFYLFEKVDSEWTLIGHRNLWVH